MKPTDVVLDASAALHLLSKRRGGRTPGQRAFHAPRLIRSEVLSAVHAQVWRGAIRPDDGREMLATLPTLNIQFYLDDARLHGRAWDIAERLGWAKTYDAEYVALADILGIPLLTADSRLARGAGHLIRIVGPTEQVAE